MEVQLKVGSDPLFAESLTKTNMASYYQTRVGVLRFSYSSDATFLRDFQLLPEFQGRGVGTKCLDLVVRHALDSQSTKLVLRVFSENPAINLYESKGFVRTSEIKGLVEMEIPLSSNI
jgi:ribosomal protein S18 acetylase RimI-like enzyme